MHSIRGASAADRPALAQLMAEFRDFWGRSEPSDAAIERGVERLLADPGADVLLAGPDGGFVAVRFRASVWADGVDGEIEDLYVRESERGRGLGRALLEAALERARRRGARRMRIQANEANAPALGLDRSLGFSSWFDPPGGHNLDLRRSL